MPTNRPTFMTCFARITTNRLGLALGLYELIGSGRCAEWSSSNWIGTNDQLTNPEKSGTADLTITQCQEKCDEQVDCKYISWNPEALHRCFLWKGAMCSVAPYSPYQTYRKKGLCTKVAPVTLKSSSQIDK